MNECPFSLIKLRLSRGRRTALAPSASMAAAQAGILFLLLYQGYAMVGGERGERRKKNVGTTWEEIAASFSVRLKEGAVCIQSLFSIGECFIYL